MRTLTPFIQRSSLTGAMALTAALLAFACATGTPDAETPGDDDSSAESTEDAAGNDTASGDAAADDSAGGGSADDDSSAAEESSSSSSASSGPGPKEVLLAEGTAFMIDHSASDMGKKAEEKCTKRAGDDVAKKANCLSKAINKMEREGFTFANKGGEWFFIRFAVLKGKKVEYNNIKVEVGEASGKKITFKTTGKDTGNRRKGRAPSELNFVVEDEYSIILDDPKRGKLVLEPKMGLFKE